MKYIVTTTLFCLISSMVLAGPFSEVRLSPSVNPQEHPDLDGTMIVWQEYWNDYGDYDVFTADVTDVAGTEFFLSWDFNQTNPQISGDWIVFQDDQYGQTDHDVYLVDISDSASPVDYYFVNTYNDEAEPVIAGNTMVWQANDGNEVTPDWNILAADVTEPNNPYIYFVDTAPTNQQYPDIYRNRIVYQDYAEFEGDYDWDIWSTDVWIKNNILYEPGSTYVGINEQRPAVWGDWVVWDEDSGSPGNSDIYLFNLTDADSPQQLTTNADDQTNPAIDGRLVVWQDDRNGNWDIYGYNRITGEEFQITSDTADQTNPTISGTVVAWEDMRDGVLNIYMADLDGYAEAADCSVPLAGDADGNCRVDMADFVSLAQNWMLCNLDPADACMNQP